ncbi:hypothetical protein ACIBKY_33315 [Nonomuraea sp. NPDC050394]|uniref:hypothetical protein n=1 Tax=Nonomuraea sp. NPDC050394 TaxID=3364363 RepID=UPI0037BDFC3B
MKSELTSRVPGVAVGRVRRWSRIAPATLLGLFAMAGLLFGATPAHAAQATTADAATAQVPRQSSNESHRTPRGPTGFQYFTTGPGQQCLDLGNAGVANGMWLFFSCETFTENGATSPGSYALWVAY